MEGSKLYLEAAVLCPAKGGGIHTNGVTVGEVREQRAKGAGVWPSPDLTAISSGALSLTLQGSQLP